MKKLIASNTCAAAHRRSEAYGMRIRRCIRTVWWFECYHACYAITVSKWVCIISGQATGGCSASQAQYTPNLRTKMIVVKNRSACRPGRPEEIIMGGGEMCKTPLENYKFINFFYFCRLNFIFADCFPELVIHPPLLWTALTTMAPKSNKNKNKTVMKCTYNNIIPT